jgi:CBS domain-containing protein
MQVSDIMTVNPSCVLPDDSLAVTARVMRALDIGIVPVIDNRRTRRLIGVITDRDIAIRCVAEGHEASCSVGEHMTMAPLHTVSIDADVSEVIALMEWQQVRRIPVVAGSGRLCGIITQADVARGVGPGRPVEVERMLARLSAPAESNW